MSAELAVCCSKSKSSPHGLTGRTPPSCPRLDLQANTLEMPLDTFYQCAVSFRYDQQFIERQLNDLTEKSYATGQHGRDDSSKRRIAREKLPDTEVQIRRSGLGYETHDRVVDRGIRPFADHSIDRGHIRVP